MVNTFAADLKAFASESRATVKEIFTASVDLTAESVVQGLPLVGSPGQPADLREGQWSTAYESEWVALISTDDPSARSVEDGISHKYGGPITLNSPIGGFHSLSLTALGFPTIVETVAQRVAPDA